MKFPYGWQGSQDCGKEEWGGLKISTDYLVDNGDGGSAGIDDGGYNG